MLQHMLADEFSITLAPPHSKRRSTEDTINIVHHAGSPIPDRHNKA